MRDLLPFFIVGLTSGSIYALAGMGLVLTYRTSGMFNFAHGALAAVGAFAFYELHTRHGMSWPLAMVICLVVVAPALGFGLERLARALAPANMTMRVVATVGLLLAVQGAISLVYGDEIRTTDQFLPTKTFTVGGVLVGYEQLIVMVIAGCAAVVLYATFRRARLGIAMQALVGDPSLLALNAIEPNRVRRSAWVVGSVFVVASGILIAPTLGLDPYYLTLLVVQAFGAAAVGRFASLPLTYVGGLLIGVGAAMSQRYIGSIAALQGVPASLPFIVLFVVLVLSRSPTHETVGAQLLAVSRGVTPRWVRRLCLPLAGVCLLVVPHVVGARLPVFIRGGAFTIVFMSLGLLVLLSGQISLCHGAFVAIGAAAFSHATHGLGLPWGIGLIVAGLAAVPLGAVVAVPAIRLSGVYLALATFGFVLLMERLAYRTGLLFGEANSRLAARPSIPGLSSTSDVAMYYIVVIVAVCAAVVVAAIGRSRLGRLLRALGDAPVGLATLGIDIVATRVLVFCISAGLAAVAGALLVATTGAMNGSGLGAFDSLTWLTVLTLAGRRVIPAGVVAAVALVVVPAYVSISSGLQSILFGATALAICCVRTAVGADGVTGWLMTHAPRTGSGPIAGRTADSWAPPFVGRVVARGAR